MSDDTYPEELYVDVVEVYDFSEVIWEDLQDVLRLEQQGNEYDDEFWQD